MFALFHHNKCFNKSCDSLIASENLKCGMKVYLSGANRSLKAVTIWELFTIICMFLFFKSEQGLSSLTLERYLCTNKKFWWSRFFLIRIGCRDIWKKCSKWNYTKRIQLLTRKSTFKKKSKLISYTKFYKFCSWKKQSRLNC